jgi:hypothetical protein
LPFVEGADVPVELEIANRVFDAKLKATANHSDVWISQSVSEGGSRTTLADVFSTCGMRKNQIVKLLVDGSRVRVSVPETISLGTRRQE